jgi:hypothetical protein
VGDLVELQMACDQIVFSVSTTELEVMSFALSSLSHDPATLVSTLRLSRADTALPVSSILQVSSSLGAEPIAEEVRGRAPRPCEPPPTSTQVTPREGSEQAVADPAAPEWWTELAVDTSVGAYEVIDHACASEARPLVCVPAVPCVDTDANHDEHSHSAIYLAHSKSAEFSLVISSASSLREAGSCRALAARGSTMIPPVWPWRRRERRAAVVPGLRARPAVSLCL